MNEKFKKKYLKYKIKYLELIGGSKSQNDYEKLISWFIGAAFGESQSFQIRDLEAFLNIELNTLEAIIKQNNENTFTNQISKLYIKKQLNEEGLKTINDRFSATTTKEYKPHLKKLFDSLIKLYSHNANDADDADDTDDTGSAGADDAILLKKIIKLNKVLAAAEAEAPAAPPASPAPAEAEEPPVSPEAEAEAKAGDSSGEPAPAEEAAAPAEEAAPAEAEARAGDSSGEPAPAEEAEAEKPPVSSEAGADPAKESEQQSATGKKTAAAEAQRQAAPAEEAAPVSPEAEAEEPPVSSEAGKKMAAAEAQRQAAPAGAPTPPPGAQESQIPSPRPQSESPASSKAESEDCSGIKQCFESLKKIIKNTKLSENIKNIKNINTIIKKDTVETLINKIARCIGQEFDENIKNIKEYIKENYINEIFKDDQLYKLFIFIVIQFGKLLNYEGPVITRMENLLL